MTNPTRCGGPLNATFTGDSWINPGRFNPEDGKPDLSDPNWVTVSTPMFPEGITGCNKLTFNPSLTVKPDTSKANSPSGYEINLHVPQSEDPNDLATPALENAVAMLPEGLAISPGAADGLQACSDNPSEPPGSPGNEIGLMSDAPMRFSNVPPTCPNASQIGTVALTTPDVPGVLPGQVYLSPDHTENHYAVFVVIRGDGLLVKLKSTIVANSVTGQLMATFAETPELPFTDFTLHLYGGPRAALVNPATCGMATTTTDLTPWAAGAGGIEDAFPSFGFEVSYDGHGAPCPSPQPFAPTFTAGTTNIQAGGFSPMSVTFSRADSDQRVARVKVTTPPGLEGIISGIPLCPEPQATEGTCSSASQIGHTIIGVGSGAAPFYLPEAGQPPNPVYLTGPYEGAPFGLTFVVPAVAGPYDLGNVIVRAKIEVDPATGALTVTSDPLPTILDGIPVQVKTVNVTIDRSSFVFNPTDCDPLTVGGSITSTQGTTAALASRFQVTGCGELAFNPKFSVSTSGHTSRKDGASLDVKLTYPNTPQGTETNIAKAKVQLPKRLPSRLKTLQKACTEQVFAANPAGCPAQSRVGMATAKSPVLPVSLTGPAYFVSHGGAKFPELVIVLQGDNVTIDLRGETFISKKGITTSTFPAVPDVPVSSFELKLPEGPYSALAANGDLCKGKLAIPTEFVAHDGATIHQSTKIAVAGCPHHRHPRTHPQKRNRKA